VVKEINNANGLDPARDAADCPMHRFFAEAGDGLTASVGKNLLCGTLRLYIPLVPRTSSFIVAVPTGLHARSATGNGWLHEADAEAVMLALAGRQDGADAFCARASGPNSLRGIDLIELNGKEQPPLLAGLRGKAGNAAASAHIWPSEASQTMRQLHRQCRRRRHGSLLLRQKEALPNPGPSNWAKPTRVAAVRRPGYRRAIWHAEGYAERHLHGSCA
jgi:hypothetical protein